VKPESQATDVVELLYRLSRSIVGDARAHVAEVADLDVGDFVLLRAIARGSSSPGVLAREFRTHPAGVSRTLTRLVGAGLIERRVAADDSRRVQLVLTSLGQSTVEHIADRINPGMQQRLNRLGAGEAAQLRDTLRQLVDDADGLTAGAAQSDPAVMPLTEIPQGCSSKFPTR
jgi:DNA-binding MarR family transcriptional regulator